VKSLDIKFYEYSLIGFHVVVCGLTEGQTSRTKYKRIFTSRKHIQKGVLPIDIMNRYQVLHDTRLIER
jgi:hypothetical protein